MGHYNHLHSDLEKTQQSLIHLTSPLNSWMTQETFNYILSRIEPIITRFKQLRATSPDKNANHI